MDRSLRWLGFVVFAAATAACASGQAANGARLDRNLLTYEQIQQSDRQNVYDVVENLRYNWLVARPPTSLSGSDPVVLVYFNGNRLGDVSTLRGIAVPQVQYIRWYDGVAASGRWGLDHGAGVIFVSTSPETR